MSNYIEKKIVSLYEYTELDMKRILTLAFAVILSASLHAQTQLSLVSCSPGEDSLNMAKIRVRLDSIRKERPVVGVVLGGGGARGMAHIGVLRYMRGIGVATEMVSMRPKNWMSGSVVDAMRSTMAIPFYFRPVRLGGMVLADGGAATFWNRFTIQPSVYFGFYDSSFGMDF